MDHPSCTASASKVKLASRNLISKMTKYQQQLGNQLGTSQGFLFKLEWSN